MATEDTNPEEQEADEGDQGEERVSPQGSSRFSRDGVDSSISSWLKGKEAKRSEGASPSQSGRLRSGRLNPVSKKQKKRNTEYKEAREQHYSDESNRRCKLCGTADNLSIHHTRGRGEHTSDTSSFVTLCILGSAMDKAWPDSNHSHSGGCHGWIEANKGFAKEKGILE